MKKSMLIVLVFVFILSCGVMRLTEYHVGYYNPFELSEFDVLGIDAGEKILEQDIAKVASTKKEQITLRKGDSIMVIQSGVMIPDEHMIVNLEKYFSVTVFTGIPEIDKKTNTSYAKAIRFASAKAGIEKIFVYWSVLEVGTKNPTTKTVSWIPIAGWAVPDQTQEIRMRLKIALIDVKTGQWTMFSPKVFDNTATSSILNPKHSCQEQIILLKTNAYQAAVESTISRYVK